MTATSARMRVADYWDEVLAGWRPGDAHLVGDLRRWRDSYAGTGDGAVDLDHYPDPYIGDLRGERSGPRLVFLGLNPGVGYDSLQGDNGIWTRRIREVGYSRCFERSPTEDAEAWLGLHQNPSRYWNNVIRFAGRWLGDPTVGVADLLNLEVYPWHSKKIVGTLRPPVDLIQKYVWDPVQEVRVNEVFAFGRVWFDVCRGLDMPEIAQWGPGARPIPGYEHDRSHWRVSFFRLPSGQLVVVSSQMGSASPPGPERTLALKQLVADHAAA